MRLELSGHSVTVGKLWPWKSFDHWFSEFGKENILYIYHLEARLEWSSNVVAAPRIPSVHDTQLEDWDIAEFTHFTAGISKEKLLLFHCSEITVVPSI